MAPSLSPVWSCALATHWRGVHCTLEAGGRNRRCIACGPNWHASTNSELCHEFADHSVFSWAHASQTARACCVPSEYSRVRLGPVMRRPHPCSGWCHNDSRHHSVHHRRSWRMRSVQSGGGRRGVQGGKGCIQGVGEDALVEAGGVPAQGRRSDERERQGGRVSG